MIHQARRAAVGGGEVRRLLPQPKQRRIGAWCFVDHFGPAPAVGPGVGPHPHTGLQTVTWLVEGRMLHGDSLGTAQSIAPGELNLMTSGRGITHWEQGPDDGSPQHGVQLWIALPASHLETPPRFEHHAELPRTSLGGWSATVLVGTFAGHASPAVVHSPLVAVELVGTGAVKLRLDPTFEYGVLVLEGASRVNGPEVEVGQLAVIEAGVTTLRLDAWTPARVLLLGGAPLDGPRVMWWNFVGAMHDDIVAAQVDWQAQAARFGDSATFPEGRIDAPPLPPFSLVAR